MSTSPCASACPCSWRHGPALAANSWSSTRRLHPWTSGGWPLSPALAQPVLRGVHVPLPLGAYQNLPSSDSARDLVAFAGTGEIPAPIVGRVITHMVGRAGIIGAGIFAGSVLAGKMRGKQGDRVALARDALAGAAAVELFALVWFGAQHFTSGTQDWI